MCPRWCALSSTPSIPATRSTFAAFAPDGRTLVGAGTYHTPDARHGEVHGWDAATGRRRWSLTFDGDATALALSPRGDVAAALGVIPAAGEAEPQQYSTHGPFSAYNVALIDAATGRGLWTLSGAPPSPGQGGALALAFSPDGVMVAVALFDRIDLWDARAGRLLCTLSRPPERAHGVVGVAFTSDPHRLVVVSELASHSGVAVDAVDLWDRGKGSGTTAALIRNLAPAAGHPYLSAVSPDGKRLVTLAQARPGPQTLSLWDLPQGEATFLSVEVDDAASEWSKPSDMVSDMASDVATDVRFLPGSQSTVAVTLRHQSGVSPVTGSVQFWDVASDDLGPAPIGPTAAPPVGLLALSPDGTRAVTAVTPPGGAGWGWGDDRLVRLRETDTGRDAVTLEGESGW